jgi:hypothetical protein
MNRLTASVLAFAATGSIVAQEPARTPNGRLEERAQSMRDQIESGKYVRSHVRVSVRLKNGNRLRGVVKDGRMVERVDGLRFVDANARDAGAGIRLWYTAGARSYVFVPFSDFAEYQVLQRLSAEELAEIDRELQVAERKRAESEAAAARAQQATPPEGGDPAPGAEVDPKTGQPAEQQAPADPAKGGGGAEQGEKKPEQELTDLHKKWFGLLQDYPPAAGWNKDKRDEIARRLIVIGARPSAHEQRFVDNFADWEKACLHFGVDQKPVKEEDEEQDGRRNRRGRR